MNKDLIFWATFHVYAYSILRDSFSCIYYVFSGTKARKFVEKLSWWIVFLGSDCVMGPSRPHAHTSPGSCMISWSGPWPAPQGQAGDTLTTLASCHCWTPPLWWQGTSQVQQCGWLKSVERQCRVVKSRGSLDRDLLIPMSVPCLGQDSLLLCRSCNFFFLIMCPNTAKCLRLLCHL